MVRKTENGASNGSQLRRRGSIVAIGTVGVAGILGGLVAGAGLFASAADAPQTFSSDLSVCANPPVAVPGTPLYTKRFTVGSGKVSGTIPAPTSTQLAALGITPTLVNVSVTTQYDSGRSGANKTDVVTVNTPGHQFSNPLLFNIPPVNNTIVVGTGTVNYSAKTTGKAFAVVTVSESVVQATSTTPATVAGTLCPAGETKVGSLQTNNVPRPNAPTAVTATPGGNATAAEAGTAPNNGAATVKFTPSVVGAAQVDTYAVLPIDLTNPNTVQEPELFVAPATTTDTTQQIAYVTGLATTDTYEFQVFAVSNLGEPSLGAGPTTPSITPAAATVTTTQGNALARSKATTK